MFRSRFQLQLDRPVWITHGEERDVAGPGTVHTVRIGGDEVQTTLNFAPDANFY